jgi:predicted nuclease of predicted toxin-antitoxin system
MGFYVVTTIERGNKGATDKVQIEYASRENRTILTFNVKDFVLLYNRLYEERKTHAGIIVSSQIPFKVLLRRLSKLLHHKTVEEMENGIEFLNNWK